MHCYHLFVISIATQPCQESSASLAFVASAYSNDVYTGYFTARYCHSSVYSSICRNGVSDKEAATLCQQQGYTGI